MSRYLRKGKAMSVVIITAERPDTPDAVALITELEAILDPLYPRESRHGLSVERLIAEAVPFFVLRSDGIAAGCGGVKLFGTAYGEIKRMYVRPAFRGRGFARRLLNHLGEYTLARGISLLRLETGIHQSEAIGLYERTGFYRISPFGAYKDDPLSVFYEKALVPR
jgi:putative acetyltransferase